MVVNLIRSAYTRATVKSFAHKFYEEAFRFADVIDEKGNRSVELKNELIDNLSQTFVDVEGWNATYPGEDMDFNKEFSTTIGSREFGSSYTIDGLNLTAYDTDTLVERLRNEGPAGAMLLETPDPTSEDGKSLGESIVSRMSDLRNVTFENVKFTNCDFSRTHISNCKLHNADIMYGDVCDDVDSLQYSPISLDKCTIDHANVALQDADSENRQYHGEVFGGELGVIGQGGSFSVASPAVLEGDYDFAWDARRAGDYFEFHDMKMIDKDRDFKFEPGDSVMFVNCDFDDCDMYFTGSHAIDDYVYWYGDEPERVLDDNTLGVGPDITFSRCSGHDFDIRDFNSVKIENDCSFDSVEACTRANLCRFFEVSDSHVNLFDFNAGKFSTVSLDSCDISDCSQWTMGWGVVDIDNLKISNSAICFCTHEGRFDIDDIDIRGLYVHNADIRDSTFDNLHGLLTLGDGTFTMSNVTTTGKRLELACAEDAHPVIVADNVSNELLGDMLSFVMANEGVRARVGGVEMVPYASPDSPGADVSGLSDTVEGEVEKDM